MKDLVPFAENLNVPGLFDNLSPPLQTALFLGLLAFVPALFVSLTAYTRIVIVLSFVRKAVTTQDIPPNLVLTGLARFLTLFVMGPTIDEINQKAVDPYLKEEIKSSQACEKGVAALRKFMLKQTRRQDLALFLHLSKVGPIQSEDDTPLRALVP